MSIENNLAHYIKSKGMSLSVISEETGIPYGALYDSFFHKVRNRQLKAREVIAVCRFIDKTPFDFEDEKVAEEPKKKK